MNNYDGFKRPSTKLLTVGSNTVTKTNNYSGSVLSSVEHSKNGAFIHHYEMDYDVMMRLGWIDDYVNGSGYTNYYAYDSYGRLIREDNGHVGYTFLYTYDNSGNITKVQKYNYSESATPSGTPTENTFTYDTTHTDRLTTFNNKSITYDNNGCVETYDGWTYSWDKGKLSSIQKGGTGSARAFVGGRTRKYTFTYNGYGQRIEKKYTYFPGLNNERDYLASCTSTYKYDLQGRLLSENRVSRYDDGTTDTKSFTFLYEGSEIVGVIFTNYAGTGTYYYDKNPLGDVIGILDNSGNTVVKYKYDAYGNCTVGASTNNDLADSNPIRYRSYYFDEDTGLYYLNARYYNPAWRRFISPDDSAYLDIENANGLNLYAYCGNDPVNYSDPSGCFPWLTLTIISGSLIVGGAIWGGISAYQSERNVFQGGLEGALVGIMMAGAMWLMVGSFYVPNGLFSNLGLMMFNSGFETMATMAEIGITQARYSIEKDVPWSSNVIRSVAVNSPAICSAGVKSILKVLAIDFVWKIGKRYEYTIPDEGGVFSDLRTTKEAWQVFKKHLKKKPNAFNYLSSAARLASSVYGFANSIWGTPNYNEWVLF